MRSNFIFLPRVGLIVLALVVSASAHVTAQEVPAAKIGVINVGRLLEESAAGRTAMERLRSLREAKEAEAKSLETQITELRDRVNEGSLSLSEERLAELRKELEDKVISYQRFQDDAQREFQKLQVEIFESIQAQVMPIITAAGEDLGFTMIFNKFESGLVFAVDEIDITDIILERFNASSASSGESSE
jgi:outer membrane protein